MTEKRYLWLDSDGNSDLQPASAFAAPPRNGWRAEYDATVDQWLVRGPYGGPARRYVRY